MRFIDLPAAHSLAGQAEEDGPSVRDPLAQLAAAAGYGDVERWWDDLVEHGTSDVFEAVEEAMAAVRETSPPPGARERQREAAMRRALAAVVADGFGRVAVVCGAWHVPALARRRRAPADAAALRGLAKGKVAMTWVPWSSRRLAAASGYGAGVRAPGWYDHLFRHGGPQVIARWFCEVARVLRAGGYPASPAQVIDATRLAETLATLRRRPLAGLAEVTDAAAAVLGEGGAAPMALVQEDLVVGTAVGSVPDDTPMVPLARDLASTQRRLRLKLERPDLGARPAPADAAGPVAPAPPADAPRGAVGSAGRGPGRGGDLPGDVAAALGARAGRAARRAQRVRHHGRGGGRGLRHPAGRR